MDLKFADLLTALSILLSTVIFILSNSRALALQKDQRRRELTTAHLVNSYRKIESACNRPRGSQQFEELETALADIQLLGTEKQIELAHQFMKAYTGAGDVGSILAQLRDELRREVGLPQTTSKLLFFRVAK